jgi:metaxin
MQTYLKLCDVNFQIVASNNHASPSGALPFLLPSTTDTTKPAPPVLSAKLQKWVLETGRTKVEESEDARYEAYLSLLDHRIRRAWVCLLPYHICNCECGFRDLTG